GRLRADRGPPGQGAEHRRAAPAPDPCPLGRRGGALSRSFPMPPSAVPPTLPLELQRRLDDVCNPYEAAWSRGARPRPEEGLRDAPEGVRAVALPELIQIEVHYRRQAGAALDPAEFHRRFPELDSTWLASLVSASARPGYPEVPGYEILGLLG